MVLEHRKLEHGQHHLLKTVDRFAVLLPLEQVPVLAVVFGDVWIIAEWRQLLDLVVPDAFL
jgi:hypothetical protein